jgi:polyisoprenyl-teichoic acid--peptidoglycan teichoic acid transferase
MNRKFLLIIVLLLFIGIACRFPIHYLEYKKSEIGSVSLIQIETIALLTKSSQKSIPTIPILPTSTTLPEPTPTPIPTPTVEPIPEAYYPGGVIRIPQQSGQINILLLGSDERPGGGFRTDVMILLNINPATGKVSIVSFPRDLYLLLPDYGYERINTSQEFGGFELTQKTFEYNFGIHPDYYMLVNFAGFKNIIDILGGIDVNTAIPLYDRCDIPGMATKSCGVEAGLNHFDGEMALWYARSRYSTSDEDRVRRCQEIMVSLFNALMSRNAVDNGPAIFQEFQSSVETNLTLEGILNILPIARNLNQPGMFHQYTFGPDQATVWIPPSGAYLLLPNPDAIHSLLIEALSN